VDGRVSGLRNSGGARLPSGEACPLGGSRAQLVVVLRGHALTPSYVDYRCNRIVYRGVQSGFSPFAGNTGIQLVQQVNETLWCWLREIITIP
jgi:hypothetical protein